MSILNKVRPNILNLQPYSSARDEFEGNGEVLLDANENPNETGLNRYPDPYQRELKNKISAIKQVRTNQIFLGNGSDEAIDLIMRIFCEPGQDNIIITDPTYGMYGVSAGINNISVKKVALSKAFNLNAEILLQEVDENSKVIFLCSPNNPSGNTLDSIEMTRIITEFEGIVVIDEAYIDFSSGTSFICQLKKFRNLIIIQTFSKAWGLAGLRLGIAFSSPEIIRLMSKVKPPYNINILTQQAALKALDHSEKVEQEVKQLLIEREELNVELNKMDTVVHVFPSSSNFLLVRFINAKNTFEYLTKKGIIVRDRSKVIHGQNCLRITVGTPTENKILIEALKEYKG